MDVQMEEPARTAHETLRGQMQRKTGAFRSLAAKGDGAIVRHHVQIAADLRLCRSRNEHKESGQGTSVTRDEQDKCKVLIRRI